MARGLGLEEFEESTHKDRETVVGVAPPIVTPKPYKDYKWY